MTSPDSQAPFNIALGVCGGIAAYKAVEVLRGLQRAGCVVRVAMTKRACEFVQPLTFRALSGSHVVVDDYAPDNPDPIAHITFSQTTDLLIVAPATANIIAKFANGIADDFLSSTYLACTAPVLIAPAMNTTMWQHPATQRNLDQLRADGVHIIDPDAGEMACKTIGPGRLSEPDRIVAAALEILSFSNKQDLVGERVLITFGATREEIDPVRFISNRSSGRMGFALAEAAAKRGAEVTVVRGVTTVEAPSGVRVIKALSAEEMSRAVASEAANTSVFIGAAAIADYRPSERAGEKIKKSFFFLWFGDHRDLHSFPTRRSSDLRLSYLAQDTAPKFFVRPTDYGMLIGARRKASEEEFYWRITQFLTPFYTMIAPRSPEGPIAGDRKSTRLNSSHSQISYAVFCLK